MTCSPDPPLAAPTEVGALGVSRLKRLWSRAMANRQGRPPDGRADFQLDQLVIHALGLGFEPTTQYLYGRGPRFDEFEQWILATAGAPAPAQVARINAAVAGGDCPPEIQRELAAITAAAPVLSAADLALWAKRGYVVVPDAVTPEARAATEAAIWEFLGMKPEEPEGWYAPSTHGINVQLFHHPALAANRRSPRIHKAFAQLWGTADLWATTDRVVFNPPLRDGWNFPGRNLDWDVSLHPPMPFGTQGLLYLTDTPPDGGAFACVPGFQRRLGEWLQGLPAGAHPRQQNLAALGLEFVGGRAGDLLIWHQALPHALGPNRSGRPQLAQFINLHPARTAEPEIWK